MNVCPNTNSKEWIALIEHPEIGQFEAMRDFMENDGEIRTPKDILKKLKDLEDESYADKVAQKEAEEKNIAKTYPEQLFRSEVGLDKKVVSGLQKSLINGKVKKANGKYGTSFYINFKQVGESDGWTWAIENRSRKAQYTRQQEVVMETTDFSNTFLGSSETDRTRAMEIATKLADRLSKQIGIDYQVITPQEAVEITKDLDNKWEGEKAFLVGDRAYYVGDGLTVATAFHEFSHPVIASIAVDNNKLFNKLYTDLVTGTVEGNDIFEFVKAKYPELEESADGFKEEVLVYGLQTAAKLKFDKVAGSTGFIKIIKDILYAAKQLLRKVFGQSIKVSELNETTTLDQLAEMLVAGDNFIINTEVVSDIDTAKYTREYADQIDKMTAKTADFNELENLANNYFDMVSKQLYKLKSDNKFEELLDIVSNKYKTGELQQIKKNLKSYQTKILQDTKQYEDEVQFNKERVQAIVNSMQNLQNMTRKIFDEMTMISDDIDTRDNVQRMMYYRDVLNYWGDFITQAEDVLDRNGARIKMISDVATSIRRANDLVNKFNEKAVEKVLLEKLTATGEAIDTKYKERVEFLTKKGAPASEFEKAKNDYENSRITPDMIRKALKGELKDANFANSFLESYSYNTDPVVGGLALFIRDNMSEVELKSQANFNTAADELKPLLDKIGYNPNKPGELGEKVGQKEKIGRINDKGEFEEVEIWRFMNEFKNADLERSRYLFKIKEASLKYQETKADEDKDALANIQAEWETHRRDYFHSEYTEEFYKAYDILRKDEIGDEAKRLMDDVYDRINLISVPTNVEDEIDISNKLGMLFRELRQLSNLHDEGGNMKTGKDLEIAQRIREFKEATQELYNTEEIPDAFKNALQNFEQRLVDEGKEKGSEQYNILRNAWLNNNTRIVIKPEFWEKMNVVSERIKELLAKIPQQQQTELDISKDFQLIKDVMTGFKDEDGQPVGGEMTEDRLKTIKEAQERIIKAQENLTKMSGLSKAEQYKLDAIYNKIFEGTASKADQVELARLMDRKSALALNKFERAELTGLFAEMEQLRRKDPTESYTDTVNSYLSGMEEIKEFHDKYKINAIDKDSAYLILNEDWADYFFEKSPDFEKWFKANHILRASIDHETGEEIARWERTTAWNVIRPNDDQYYEKTTIKDDEGNVIMEVNGLPSMKYSKRIVKDEYTTPKIVGHTVDNSGNWLPKNMAAGAKDDRYINKDYDRIKNTNKDLYAVIQKMTELHLKHQKGLSKKAKLYLDFPRYRKQTIERLQSKSLLQRLIQRLKDFWMKVKDGWDAGFNFKEDFQLVKLDLFDDETSGIPISGLSNLDMEEVSTDVAYSMMRYMLSAERQKKLVEISPVARALQSVVNNKANFPFVEKTMNNRILQFMGKKKDKYIRAQAVNNMLEREFEGKVNTGWGADNAAAQNFSNFLFKRASFAYLALNIPSAIKNSIGAKFQGLVESTAGKYMSTQSFLGAEAWATSTAFKISHEIYKQGSKSVDVQLVEIFDPERNRFSYTIGESLTRTPIKDTMLIMDRMNDFRKWTQLQASLQTFGGMMKHQKVDQNGKKIAYIDAWEVKDGKIQLKAGVDPTWGITYDKDGNQILGDKFKAKRNEMQRVIDNLNGAMGQQDKPEAERYLMYRYISFFRRYFTSMFVNRFGYSGSIMKGTAHGRADYVLGDTKEGFYITALKLLIDTTKAMGKNLPYMTRDEKQAAIRLTSEIGVLMLMSMLLPALMGYDPDDEDRYAKLRRKSGPLPFLFVDDDPNRPFDMGGWLGNHMLLMVSQIRGENDQFLPAPGFGLNDYEQYLDIKSLVMGPTIKSLFNVSQDLGYMVTGDERAYYKRNVGSYSFQDEDSLKLWSHMAKMVGLTGGTIDPAVAMKNYQNAQNR